jgi:pyruvate,orthophosphate dikinase
MASKYVYRFGNGTADGAGDMKDLLGSKGANLAEMNLIKIPVPPGFTITTDVCRYSMRNPGSYPSGLKNQVTTALKAMESLMGSTFGDRDNPLLLSVRSGAAVSMPGMMDTVLNLGLSDRSVVGLAVATGGDDRFAWDSYRRLIQMYGNVVMEVDGEHFERIIERAKKRRKVAADTGLTADDWREVVANFKDLIKRKTGKTFPQSPLKQLWGAIDAVFSSWNNPRARTYRQLNRIPDDLGTAVNVQAMVFGNLGETSATGVAFTRDPATGENVFYGEWLLNAQGEDVVAGIRTPLPLIRRSPEDPTPLSEQMPAVFKQLDRVRSRLEKHYKEMQDLEFTVQERRLWILQTRTGKRTAQAATRIAVDMVKEKLLTREKALLRLDPMQLDQLLHPSFVDTSDKTVLARGLPASPGAAVGRVVFTAKEAEDWADEGRKVILVRIETSPDDIGGMDAAEGILTARGGMTSHAAVVARGMGKCCVAGCEEIYVDYSKHEFRVGSKLVQRGDWISLNGTTGEVMPGQVPTMDPELSQDYYTLMKWADQARSLKVRTNADTPGDARVARKFGAEGIGLCRTEHMFFEGQRLNWMRRMILADSEKGRRAALKKLLPIQRRDFEGIFKEMDGLPVTIRLLDPPLHEFLPHAEEAIRAVADEFGARIASVRRRAQALAEFNPMLGHRGCRLGITYPEIYEMQAQAIFEAACNMSNKGIKVLPEVMIPLVGTVKEFTVLKEKIVEIAEEVIARKQARFDYLVGTMIEIPRACLVAREIAREAEFFSFGTNDLTQLTFGYSRDDSGRFLPPYVEQGILPGDPFLSLDVTGVGEMVATAVERGRQGRKGLKVGVCGEHGGDPPSVAFFHDVGLDYVSCSPYRVPIARLAAAQAVLNGRKTAERTGARRGKTRGTGAKPGARSRGKPKSGVAPKKV